MIFFCDVLAYTTYNHTYFLRRKKAIRRKDVPMKHQKKKLGQTEMEKYYKAASSRNPIINNITNCSRQDKHRQNHYGKLGKYKLLYRG